MGEDLSTMFGRLVNGTRIGVAPGVKKALIGKILGPGGGSSDQVVRAVSWAREEGAQVIFMSLEIDFSEDARLSHFIPPASLDSKRVWSVLNPVKSSSRPFSIWTNYMVKSML